MIKMKSSVVLLLLFLPTFWTLTWAKPDFLRERYLEVEITEAPNEVIEFDSTPTVKGYLCLKNKIGHSNSCHKLAPDDISKYELKFTYPYSTTDITSSVRLIEAEDRYHFEVTLPPLAQTAQAPRFEVFLFQKGHGRFGLQIAHKKILAHIERLEQLQDKLNIKGKRIFQKHLKNLKNVANKVEKKIHALDSRWAERSIPLQLNNFVAAPSSWMVSTASWTVEATAQLGIGFKGENSWFDLNFDAFDEVDAEWKIEVRQDSQTIFENEGFSGDYAKRILLLGEKIGTSNIEVRIWGKNQKKNKFNWELIFKRDLDLVRIEDFVSPSYRSFLPAPGRYVGRDVPSFALALEDLKGRMDRSTVDGELVEDNGFRYSLSNVLSFETSQSTLVSDIHGGQNGSDLFNITGIPQGVPEGFYSLHMSVKDFAGNQAPEAQWRFIVDRTPPSIALPNVPSFLSNDASFELPISVQDATEVVVKVFVNGSYVDETNLKEDSLAIDLVEGVNFVRVTATDEAGNMSEVNYPPIFLDTTAPVLANINLENGQLIRTQEYTISGTSNEYLRSVIVNGLEVELGEEKTVNFSHVLKHLVDGEQRVEITLTDLAGNSVDYGIDYHFLLRLIDPHLIAVVTSDQKDRLKIIGHPGATRPRLEISAEDGLLNTAEVTANDDGSFELELDTFIYAKVSAYDPGRDRSESAVVSFKNDTTLAGQVRDTDDNPLPGVTVTIVSTGQSAITDASGTFSISNPALGDQLITIDGRTISPDITKGLKEFSIISMNVVLGNEQKNILERTIYLAPKMLDGTETEVLSGSATFVSSPHAPRVELDIPANASTFPGGSKTGTINIIQIPASKTSIDLLEAAEPEKVYALEPSGLKFNQPVKLTLPNNNDFPEGTELVVLTKNSETGNWELDGAATVTEANVIETKPGQGITHFSEVYVAPLGMEMKAFKDGDKPTFDIMSGAVSTSMTLPSFKSMGEDVAPALVYNSQWANPTIVISNIFDLPRKYFEMSGSVSQGSWAGKVKATETIQTWITPEYIDAQFTSSILTSEKIRFTGMPDKSLISYQMDLVDLPSGIHPAKSSYEIRFKELTIRTQKVKTKTLFGKTKTKTTTWRSEKLLEEIFPQELVTTIYHQNMKNSEVGSGWRLNMGKKILNPTQDRIMIEHENGQISAYSIKNSVETVQFDNKGIRSFTLDGDNIYGVTTTGQVLKSTTVSNAQVISTLQPYQGQMGVNTSWYSHWTRRCTKSGWKGCKKREYSYYYYCGKYDVDYSFQRKVKSMLIKNGELIYLDQLGAIWGGNPFYPIAGYYDTPSPFTIANNSTSEQSYQSHCQAIGGSDCGSTRNNYNNYMIKVVHGSTNALGWCNVPQFCYSGNCTSSWKGSQGRVPLQGFQNGAMSYSKFNQPVAMINGPIPDSYLVADYGNNVVRLVDTISGTVSTFAGNRDKQDYGDGGFATSASIFHPRGLALEEDGSVLIANESGYIRKVTSDGKIFHFAGKPTSKGGVLTDITSMKDVALSSPSGMVFDYEKNYLYVADTGHNRILRFDLNIEEARVVAGNGTCATDDVFDGKAALEVSLCRPEQIALDSNGNLLVLDEANKRVRRINFSTPEDGLIRYQHMAKDNSQLYRAEDGRFLLSYRDGRESIFSPGGLELEITDRLGRRTVYEYDGSNRLITATLPTGQKIQLIYSGERLSNIIDAAGRSTQFGYSNGYLISVNFPDGTEKTYDYLDNGVLFQETNQRGLATNYILDNWGRLQQIKRPDGSYITVKDSVSETISNNNTNGNSTELKSFGTDQQSLKDTIADAKGNTTSFLRDINGYVQEIIDNRGEVVKIERDSEGRPTKITKPDQSYVELTYNMETGDLLRRFDSSSATSEEYAYNPWGQLISYKDPLNNIKTNIYDEQTGLLIKEIDANGNYKLNSYGPLGLVASTTNRIEQTNLYSYDPQGNLISITSPMGEVTNYNRDNAGNIVSKSNANGQTTSFDLDLFNRIITVKTPGNLTTSYSYLSTGELTTITNNEGYQTLFEYDDLGRLIKRTSPRGQVSQLFYDQNNNIVKEITPNGDRKIFEYDDRDQLVRKILPDDEYTFSYNDKGSVISASNKSSKIDYSYVSILGEEYISNVQVSGPHTPSYSLNYEYNSSGHKISMQSDYISLGYALDSAYRLIGVSNNSGQNFSFNYDFADKLINVTRSNSVNTIMSYDSNSFLTEVAHLKNPATIENFIYTRDNIGNRTSVTSRGSTKTFSYDDENQLISATHPEADDLHQLEQFSYDSLGNRIADNQGNYSYDEKKFRLEEDWRFIYSYDLNGNLISKQEKGLGGKVWNYIYSSENQLVQADHFEGGIKIKSLEFSYDVNGRRIRKYVHDFQSNSEFERFYAYDGSEIIAEIDESDNILARYTHSGLGTDDVLSVEITGEGVSRGLAHTNGNFHYLKDGLGSIQAITDDDGNVVQRYVYSSFGKLLRVTNQSGLEIAPRIKTPFTFTNRELDSEMGLYYYRARYYDPHNGRFLQEDPHPGLRANPISSVNKYSYTENNPIMNTDSTGLNNWLDSAISKVAKFTNSTFEKATEFSNEVVLKKFGIKISAAQFTRAVVITGATAGLFIGFSTGNPHLASASGATLFYNVHNWNKDGKPSDIIWNSTKMAAAGLVGAEVALFAGAGGGLLVLPTTYATARLMGFNRSDAIIGASGATVGFGLGTWKDSGTSGGGSGTKLKGGRYNDAGTWVPE